MPTHEINKIQNFNFKGTYAYLEILAGTFSEDIITTGMLLNAADSYSNHTMFCKFLRKSNCNYKIYFNLYLNSFEQIITSHARHAIICNYKIYFNFLHKATNKLQYDES